MFAGSAQLDITTNDLGGSGSGGAKTDTDRVAITVGDANDAPTGAVAVSGTATEGQTLVADTSAVADVDGLGPFSYQWARSADGGATWASIAGATASTLTLGGADVGTLIRVSVGYTDGQGMGRVDQCWRRPGGQRQRCTDRLRGDHRQRDRRPDRLLTRSSIADADGLGPFSYQWQQSSDGGATWANVGRTAAPIRWGMPTWVALVRVDVTYVDGQGTLESVTSSLVGPVINVNDVPTTSGLADVAVLEDAADSVIDLFVAFADAEDADAALTYTVTANTNTGLFSAATIDGAGGTLTLGYASGVSGMAAITVRATDTSGAFVESTFAVDVSPVDDAPTAVMLTSISVPENLDTSGGYTVGTLSSSDPDTGDTHTYSVVGGADGAKFLISADLLMLDDGALDFEAQSSYQVTVRSTIPAGCGWTTPSPSM